MKIYAVSGLGADERAFDFLKLNVELIPLLWIEPIKDESIAAYGLRLSEKIDTSEDYIILGLSFGGLVATEMSKTLKPKATILVSSVEVKYEIPLSYRLFGKTGFLNLIPKSFFNKYNFMLDYLLGTQKKELLKEIIEDSNVDVSKWALSQLFSWQNKTRLENCLKISGSKDKLFPVIKDAIVINGGQHFMIIDDAEKVSSIINDFLGKLQ